LRDWLFPVFSVTGAGICEASSLVSPALLIAACVFERHKLVNSSPLTSFIAKELNMLFIFILITYRFC